MGAFAIATVVLGFLAIVSSAVFLFAQATATKEAFRSQTAGRFHFRREGRGRRGFDSGLRSNLDSNNERIFEQALGPTIEFPIVYHLRDSGRRALLFDILSAVNRNEMEE
tara:strand:- start:58 stop:387 length:330 start_codon:yes stop_codon:yes gene_type:complete